VDIKRSAETKPCRSQALIGRRPFHRRTYHIIPHTMSMLRPLRTRTLLLAPLLHPPFLFQFHRSYATRDRTSDRIPTNDPSPPEPGQNVSDTNAIPISPMGLRDSELPLQEMPEDSERQRVMQAPNRKEPWSRSQQPRERAMSGPRFEQTIMEYQVRDKKEIRSP